MKTIASMHGQKDETAVYNRSKTIDHIGDSHKEVSLVEVLINDPIKIVNEMGYNRVGSGSSLKSNRSRGKSGDLKRVISREKIKELV